MGYIVHFYSFKQTFIKQCNKLCNTCSLKYFLGGGGGLTYMCLNLSDTSMTVIKLTSIKLRIPNNRLIGYIVTLIHSDHILWEYLMNYVTLYSLKCLLEGGGVLLVYIYICIIWSHAPIIGIKLTSI